MNINDQISSALAKIDEKYYPFVLGGIIVVIFALDFLVIMKPQMTRFSSLNKEISKLSTDFKNAQNDFRNAAQYSNDAIRLKEQINKMNYKITAKEQVPLILERISRIASQNRIEIDQMMPNMDAQQSLLKNNEGQYYEIPIFMETRCGYHDFGRFLNAVEKDDMFLRVADFILMANSADPVHHRVQLRIKAIIFDKAVSSN